MQPSRISWTTYTWCKLKSMVLLLEERFELYCWWLWSWPRGGRTMTSWWTNYIWVSVMHSTQCCTNSSCPSFKLLSLQIRGTLNRGLSVSQNFQNPCRCALSCFIEAASGAFQGAMFGPLLFTMLVNNLPDFFEWACTIFMDDFQLLSESGGDRASKWHHQLQTSEPNFKPLRSHRMLRSG